MTDTVNQPPPTVNVTVRQKRWGKRLFDAGWASYGLGVVALGATMYVCTALGFAHPPPIAGLVVLGSLLLGAAAPLLWLAGLVAGRKKALSPASVSVSQAGELTIVSSGELDTLGRGALVQGAVQADGALVIDDARGRELTIHATPERAAELLDALDLEPERRRFAFRWQRLSERFMGYVGGLFGASVLLLLPFMVSPAPQNPAFGCLLVTAPWLLAELVSRWTATREITVGLDGIEAKSRRGRALVRFADLKDVRDTGGELEVTMKDGTVHRLLADLADPATRAALLDRIREARALTEVKAGERTLETALLDRAGKSLGEWRAAAARILTAATGFRGASIGAAELGSVMDDATAPAEQRLAAAIALGSDPAQRPRIRVAADTAVSPRMRVALEELADGAAEDAILEQALAEEADAAAAREERSR